jgi:hypothetical protein
MKFSALRFAALLAFVACFSVGEASANTITVNNSSFETIGPGGLPNGGCGVSCSFSVAAIPGWTNSGVSGQFQPGPPTNMSIFNDLPDGITVGYTNGPAITQTVGATVQDGVTYTLTVGIGFRKDTGFGGSADLVIGGVTDILATGTIPAPGEWAFYTATYTGTALTAGQSIGIQLNETNIQGDFDEVALSDNARPVVPEPSSLSLLALGLTGVAGAVGRKFRS